MKWHAILLHWAATIVLGSFVISAIAFTTINAMQGTFHTDGLAGVFFISLAISSITSFPVTLYVLYSFHRASTGGRSFADSWTWIMRRYWFASAFYVAVILMYLLYQWGTSTSSVGADVHYDWDAFRGAILMVVAVVLSYAGTGRILFALFKEKFRYD